MRKKNICVTGGTGFIGQQLVKTLAEAGHTVHAIVRSSQKAQKIAHKNVILFQGDITDPPSIAKAMESCEEAYHNAAFAQVWAKDKTTFHRLNVDATCNVFEAALQEGVRRVVYTSTAGVLGPSLKGIENVNEKTVGRLPFFSLYEHTKALAEDKARAFLQRGLDIVIVNPTRVYGPGELSKSNSVTVVIKRYLQGKWHINPGNGEKVGNYVFVDDVVQGMLLAMEKGRSSERYILGGENASYTKLFRTIQEVSHKHHWLIKLPTPVLIAISYAMQAPTWLFGIPPLITPNWTRRCLHHWSVSCDKAKNELGYNPRTLSEGVRTVIDWVEHSEITNLTYV